jgi:exonuclease SbcD
MDRLDEVLLPIKDRSDNTEVVVAAIPFLQDRFIRQVGESEGIKEIDGKIREGMRRVFTGIGTAMKKQYPNRLHIGMAHLHARIHYASSPISLGFSENVYKHKLIQLETDGATISQTFVPVPRFRSLYQVKGTLQEVETKLALLQCKYRFDALLDLTIDEETYDPLVMPRLEVLKNEMLGRNMKVVSQRVIFRDKSSSRKMGNLIHDRVKDLEPTMVFEKIIEEREDNEEKSALKDLFSTLLADATQQQP